MSKLLILSGMVAMAGFITVCFGSFVSLGHSEISYSVVNNTEEDLLTWGMKGDCSEIGDRRDDYLFEELVPAGSTVEYWDYGPGLSADCIHITTLERQLVRVSEYRLGVVIAVDEPVANEGEVVPLQQELPGRTAKELWITDTRLPYRLMQVGAILFGVGILGAIVLAVQESRRQQARPR